MSNRQDNLPVLVNPPEQKAKGKKDEDPQSKKSGTGKVNWLGTLFNKRGHSDFQTGTSLQGIYVRKKRLLNTTVVFLALDILLVSILVILLTKTE